MLRCNRVALNLAAKIKTRDSDGRTQFDSLLVPIMEPIKNTLETQVFRYLTWFETQTGYHKSELNPVICLLHYYT